MKTEIWSEFIIDEFPMKHEELTEFLGIQPTEAENVGDIIKSPTGKNIEIGISSWTLDSGCDKHVDFETQVVALLNKIRPYKDRFIKICEKYPLHLNVVIQDYGNCGRPYIGWESDVMKELAEYNASWGIDLYVYDKEDYEE